MSDSVRPHRRQPTRLLRPWDSPGKNTGVGCHFLLQCMKVKSESEVAQSCPTLGDPMDCSLPGFSVHGIFQARRVLDAFYIHHIHNSNYLLKWKIIHFVLMVLFMLSVNNFISSQGFKFTKLSYFNLWSSRPMTQSLLQYP